MRSSIAASILCLVVPAVSTAAFAAPVDGKKVYASSKDEGEQDKEKDKPKEEAPADEQAALRSTIDEATHKRFLHGFRLGYLYVANINTPVGDNNESLAHKYGIKNPNQFLLGYEATWRMIGHDWLNVLLLGNVTVSGLEQSLFLPSANLLIGFELSEVAQIGVGVNASPTADKPAHMIVAAGITPRVGDFYVPLHVFFIPDVDQNHRMGATVGVNF